jgi:hypothetical protein
MEIGGQKRYRPFGALVEALAEAQTGRNIVSRKVMLQFQKN